MKVKQAEAHAETLQLRGIGTANGRRAIAKGAQEALNDWASQNPQHTTKEAIDMLLVTQYLDTLSSVGANELIILRPS